MLTRQERLFEILEILETKKPAHNALIAYKQLTEAINEYEDSIWGSDNFCPPRTFLDGERTKRLYTIMPESFHLVPGYSHATLLLAKKELVFISDRGAIQLQFKEGFDFEKGDPSKDVTNRLIFNKADALGCDVWGRVCVPGIAYENVKRLYRTV